MHVDLKVLSRNHQKSLTIEGAILDPNLPHSIFPIWILEELRTPTRFLPTGYFTEKETKAHWKPLPRYKNMLHNCESWKDNSSNEVDAILAGPVALYIVGQNTPCFENALFVDESQWRACALRFGKDILSQSADSMRNQNDDSIECDIRLGRDCIEHSTFLSELRPGGLLNPQPLEALKNFLMAWCATMGPLPGSSDPGHVCVIWTLRSCSGDQSSESI